MKAGLLNEKIEIYSKEVTISESGSVKHNYELFYTTRANVRHNSGSQVDSNGEVFYPTNKTFIVRQYVPVKEPMRIKYDDKFYKIISINLDKTYNNKVIIAELINE